MIQNTGGNSLGGKICDHASEYLGSHILDAGVAQDTWLATWRGRRSVACAKTFTSQEERLHFILTSWGEYFLDIKGEPVQYEYMKQIMEGAQPCFLAIPQQKEIINTFGYMVVIR